MDPLIIPASDDTPEIIFNKSIGKFEITGKSLPEDVIEFYTPVFKWLDDYLADPNDETVLRVKVIYFNSASQRALNEIFTILSRLKVKGRDVKVDWFFHEDDDEMKEAGEEYAEITNIPFTYKTFAM